MTKYLNNSLYLDYASGNINIADLKQMQIFKEQTQSWPRVSYLGLLCW